MFTMKRVVMLAIASVLVTGVARTDRVYARGPGQSHDDDQDRGNDHGQKRWGSDQMPRAGACFFNDKDFGGEYFCVEPGEELAQVPPDMGDKISSFRILGDVEVIVYRDVRFKGSSGRFLTEVRDLRKEGWNDQISSVRVSDAKTSWGRDRAPAWGREEMPREGACFYQDANFHGDYFCVPRGASYASLPPGFNDKISSIRLASAGVVVISENRDFDGRTTSVSADLADLRQSGWNDKVSSIRVF